MDKYENPVAVVYAPTATNHDISGIPLPDESFG